MYMVMRMDMEMPKMMERWMFKVRMVTKRTLPNQIQEWFQNGMMMDQMGDNQP